ncbi:hypothetical protein J6590_028192 [Homalodisca vitripennis]|nr:hypothetical protein J6590_028192 [Homalodisca vitripennis]
MSNSTYYIHFLIVILSTSVISFVDCFDSEYDEPVSITLYHSTTADPELKWTERGLITIQNVVTGDMSVSQKLFDSEYDGPVSITLYHSTTADPEPKWTERGLITIQNVVTGDMSFDSEYDGPVSITLYHSTTADPEPKWTERGLITIQNVVTGDMSVSQKPVIASVASELQGQPCDLLPVGTYVRRISRTIYHRS